MSEPLFCINHPNKETYLRCNRCGMPICSKCAVRTEVGYRCRACINRQQEVFYAGFRPVYYLIAVAVALPLGLIGGLIIPALGWYAILLGPLAGLGITEAVRWAIGRRRGKYVWLVIAGAILFGALPQLAILLLPLAFASLHLDLFTRGALPLLWWTVYLVGAIGTVVVYLRPHKR